MAIRDRLSSGPGAAVIAGLDERELRGIGLVAPAVALIAIALVWPFLNAIAISFADLGTNEFVGLEHYRWLLGQDIFWFTLRNSLIWTVGNLALQGTLGIGLALLLHDRFPGRDLIRTVLLVPFVIPTVVVATTWRWILNTSYGPINAWLVELGLLNGAVNPLADPELALAAVTLINTWRWTPLVALVVFAVLQTIPEAEYEAARVEGAGIFQEFYHVTYPHLSRSLTVLGLLGFLLTFNIFDMIWLLTNGGPVNATTTLPVFIFEIAFNLQNVARGTAVSVVLFLMLVVFVVLYFQQSTFKEGDLG